MAPFSFLPTLLFLLPAAIAAAPPPRDLSSSLCQSSCNAHLCNSIITKLQASKIAADDYGLAAVQQSIRTARRTARFLRREGRVGPAADDCREMAEWATGDLKLVRAMLAASRRGGSVMTAEEADTVRTLMSAALGGSAACLDGLEQAALAVGEVHRRAEEANRLYGVAVGIVDRTLEMMGVDRPVINDTTKWTNFPTNASKAVGSLIVNVPANQTVTVAKDGSGDFTSVNDAVAFASLRRNERPPLSFFKIVIMPGVYVENVVVPKKLTGLILCGSGIRRTFITGNRSVRDGYTTFQSASVAVNADGFIATGITFQNTAGREKMQAVAVRNAGDRSIFYKCRFMGFQDTLYAHTKRQLYLSSHIHGTVDFIFGRAAAVFQNCSIVAHRPLDKQSNTITAQGKICPRERSGFSIHLSRVLPARDLMSSTGLFPTYLGRPWKSYSTVVFMQSYMHGFIEPRGWLQWDDQTPPSTVYYGEFENYGEGAGTERRVMWEESKRMGRRDAQHFTVAELINGDTWLWPTSIPYLSGLLVIH